MTKQEVIAQAYGKSYELLKNRIDYDNGYVQRKVIGHGVTNELEYDMFNFNIGEIDIFHSNSSFTGNYFWRPKMLVGIENNNGWNKISSLLLLPTIKGKYTFLRMGSHKEILEFDPATSNIEKFSSFTHWKPFIEDKNPHY